MIPTALSIAGSDPSGGAGIQADLKTFCARGVYGMSALTALTAQNTCGVTGVHSVPPEFVTQQITTIFEDIRVDAIKIGMIATAEIARDVGIILRQHPEVPVVLDPVMIAKGGHSLLQEDAIAALRDHLLPYAHILTPNLPEAAQLLGEAPAQTRDEIERQGRALLASGARAVLIKGGHLGGTDSPDMLITDADVRWYEAARIETINTHGTGCTLSAAIAAELTKGHSLEKAVGAARSYLLGAIEAADQLRIGSGHGPVDHFHEFRKYQ